MMWVHNPAAGEPGPPGVPAASQWELDCRVPEHISGVGWGPSWLRKWEDQRERGKHVFKGGTLQRTHHL